MFEKFVKILPIVTAAIFLLSYTYLSTYYGAFNINILVYFNNLEIVNALLPITVVLFTAGFSFMIQADDFITKNKKIKINGEGSKEVEDHSEEDIRPKKFNKFFYLFPFLLFIAERIVHYFISPYYDEPLFSVLPLVATGIVLAFHYRSDKKFEIFNAGFLVISFLYFGFICYMYSLQKVLIARQIGIAKNISFRYGNKFITTSTNFFPIGESHDFLFFYNKADSNTAVFKRSDVDSLIIK